MTDRIPHPKYPAVTRGVVRDLIAYNPQSGAMTWRQYRGPKARPGDEAGMVLPKGHVVVTLLGYKIPASHIAWVSYYGAWPLERIYLKDKDQQNLRISNLQPASEHATQTELAARRRRYYRSYAARQRDPRRLDDAQLDKLITRENREVNLINRRLEEAETTVRHPVTHRKRRTTRRAKE